MSDETDEDDRREQTKGSGRLRGIGDELDNTGPNGRGQTTDNQLLSSSGEGDSSDTEASSKALDMPAFGYDSRMQHAIYVRDETWDRLNDLLFQAEFEARNRSVRDVPNRELHDAAIRVLMKKVDAETIAKEIIDQRRGSQ